MRLRFSRTAAIEYVLTFVAFWADAVAGVLTRSTQLHCDPSGCPVTPAHPVLLVIAFGLGVGFVVQAVRQTRVERYRVVPDSPATARYFVVMLVMFYGLGLASAVRAIRGSGD